MKKVFKYGLPAVTQSSLHCAAEHGDLQALRYLVQRGGDFDKLNKDKRTPLHLAAERNHVECVQELLDRDVRTNLQDEAGRTALHLACRHGYQDVVATLLGPHNRDALRGEALRLVDHDGLTCLMLAVEGGHTKVVDLLLRANVDVQAAMPKSGLQAIHLAALGGHALLVAMLVSHGSKVDSRSLTGDTPMHLAASSGALPVVAELCMAGADVHVLNKAGQMPLDLALAGGHRKVASYLEAASASVLHPSVSPGTSPCASPSSSNLSVPRSANSCPPASSAALSFQVPPDRSQSQSFHPPGPSIIRERHHQGLGASTPGPNPGVLSSSAPSPLTGQGASPTTSSLVHLNGFTTSPPTTMRFSQGLNLDNSLPLYGHTSGALGPSHPEDPQISAISSIGTPTHLSPSCSAHSGLSGSAWDPSTTTTATTVLSNDTTAHPGGGGTDVGVLMRDDMEEVTPGGGGLHGDKRYLGPSVQSGVFVPDYLRDDLTVLPGQGLPNYPSIYNLSVGPVWGQRGSLDEAAADAAEGGGINRSGGYTRSTSKDEPDALPGIAHPAAAAPTSMGSEVADRGEDKGVPTLKEVAQSGQALGAALPLEGLTKNPQESSTPAQAPQARAHKLKSPFASPFLQVSLSHPPGPQYIESPQGPPALAGDHEDRASAPGVKSSPGKLEDHKGSPPKLSDATRSLPGTPPAADVPCAQPLSPVVRRQPSDLFLEGLAPGLEPSSPPPNLSSLLSSLSSHVRELEITPGSIQEGQRIGAGSFGEVVKAVMGGTEVAVKKLTWTDDGPLDPGMVQDFADEVTVMARLRHPNVLLFMGYMIQEDRLCIVTEYMKVGSLFRVLHRSTANLSSKRRLAMARDTAKGMHYLHSLRPPIVHLDLKSQNLLVHQDGSVKVADFGLSRMMKRSCLTASSVMGGTAEWMAPEVLLHGKVTEKSDVFSYGVVLWELATRQVPWQDYQFAQVVAAVGLQGQRLPLDAVASPQVRRLIEDCWHQDPGKRPDFATILTRLEEVDDLS